MNTFSHTIITAALNRRYKTADAADERLPVVTWALLLGSFLPDVPLYILSAVFIANNVIFAETPPPDGMFGEAYDTLYFTDPLWIVGHNALHAPLMVGLLLAVGYWWGVRGSRRWALALFWFALGCGLHSSIDILTHANDGPLLLFPFDWQTRFSSPISYWDPQYYGNIFGVFEQVLNVGLLAYLWVSRPKREQTPPTPESESA